METKQRKKNVNGLPGLNKRISYLEEIAERRLVHTLEHGERKYRSMMSYIPDVIWTADEESRVVFISQNIRALTGYTPEEEYEMARDATWFDRIHPDDTESTVTAYNALIEERKPYNIEYRFRRRDGSWIWLNDRAVATYEVGGVKYADGLLTDITARKQSEVELKRLKEKYESLIRNIPVAALSCLPDETATMLFISERYKDWTGYSPEDFYKDPGLWPKTVHPEDRERAVKTWFEACKKKTEYDDEYRVVHKDTGEIRWVRDHAVLVKDKEGNGIIYNGIMTDITARKMAEHALQESEEFSTGLLNNSPNPIVVINSDASIRYVNPAMTKMTGFSARELLTKKPPYPWWAEETQQKTSRGLQKGIHKKMRGVEEPFQKKNGDRFWGEASHTPVTSNGEFKYLLLSWVDITEQKRLREDMQHYIREITLAQEQERKRVSRELHDETIQSLADLCTDVDVIIMKEKLSERVNRQVRQLRVKIQNTLNEVRRFSHELRPGLLDHFGLIPSLELLKDEWKSDGRLDCNLEVIGHEKRLSSQAEIGLFRIAQEALRNARKHSKATETVIRVEFARNKVKLSVVDNGNGFEVPKELGSLTRRGKLGLMGMKERAHLLGGSFKIQSKLGKGTSVTVEVPAK